MTDPNRWTPEHGYKGAVRFHTHSGWWFTRMPNGDVVVSDGTVGVTLNADTWESVVREMSRSDDG